MRQATVLLTIGAVAVCTSAASAQHWVNFENETTTRLIAASGDAATNTDEKDYAFADLDGDGDIDLVCVMKQPFTSSGRRVNRLFMNEGVAQGHAINGVLVDRTADLVPQFLDQQSGQLAGTNDRDVVIADVNGDGWPDVITATTLSGVPLGSNGAKHYSHPRIYINQGQSNGQPPPLTSTWLGLEFDDDDRVPLMPTEPRFCSVAAGDVDDDGDLDLYFGDYQQGGSRTSDLNDRLWINNGNGYFTDQSTTRMTAEMLESSFGMAVIIADMNNDGFNDILKDDALNAPQGVSISYNNPANPGFFNNYDVPHNHAPYHVVVGSLNNDGLLDMVVSDDFSDRYRLHTGNNGSDEATFSNHTFSFSGGGGDDGFASDNYIVDLDNNGWNDVLICDVDVDIGGCGRHLHAYRNLGQPGDEGGFVNLQQQTIGGQILGGIPTSMLVGTHDVAVFDINGDGWKDLVIGRCTGTQIWINQPPDGLAFNYPGGLPSLVAPDESFTFDVTLTGENGGTHDPGTGTMHLSINGGPFNDVGMTHLGGNNYEATLPAGPCLDVYQYYFSGETVSGSTFNDPPAGAATPYLTTVAESVNVTFEDYIEDSTAGWTVTNDPSLVAGGWQAGVPNEAFNSGTQTAPSADAGSEPGHTKAWITGIGSPGDSAGIHDVDGGPTQLITPAFDLAGTDGTVSYARWFVSMSGSTDSMVVEISNNNGASWTLVETVGSQESEWIDVTFSVSDFVTPTDQLVMRFTVDDSPNDSVTEGGIDNFVVEEFVCGDPPPSCLGDMVDSKTFQPPADGQVDGADLAFLLGEWGRNPGSLADIVDSKTFQPPPDGTVDGADLAFMLGAWGTCD